MFNSRAKICKIVLAAVAVLFSATSGASASELDLIIPNLAEATYKIGGFEINGNQLLIGGMGICFLGMLFGLWEFFGIKKLPAHESMLKVSETIYATCSNKPSCCLCLNCLSVHVLFITLPA